MSIVTMQPEPPPVHVSHAPEKRTPSVLYMGDDFPNLTAVTPRHPWRMGGRPDLRADPRWWKTSPPTTGAVLRRRPASSFLILADG